jgi:AraC-like DNA-binding protein
MMNAQNAEIDAQKYGADPFSQLLHLLSFDVSIYHNAKVCGNWRITEHSIGSTCFHIVISGGVILDVPGHIDGLLLNAGDLVIFPREIPHGMVSSVAFSGEQQHLDYHNAVNLEGTGLVCGQVRFKHQGYRFILNSLPDVFVVRQDMQNHWLSSILDMFLTENLNIGPASQAIFDKLSELMFTYALRQHLSDRPGESGMLAIYGHPKLAKALEAIHKYPDRDWTLDALAKTSAMSRTSFSETFKSVSGWTAGQYLTWWRMQLAWSYLKGGKGVAETADRIGYRSESAFSRAFQKTFQTSAGKIRKAMD